MSGFTYVKCVTCDKPIGVAPGGVFCACSNPQMEEKRLSWHNANCVICQVITTNAYYCIKHIDLRPKTGCSVCRALPVELSVILPDKCSNHNKNVCNVCQQEGFPKGGRDGNAQCCDSCFGKSS